MKKFFTYFSLAIFITMGTYVMITAADLPRTYNGKNTNIYEIQGNSPKYSLEEPYSASEIIIKESIEKTRSLNIVNAVVFDFRGYDALGQSFILLTTVTGCSLMLSCEKKRREESDEEDYKG